jgi:hypothetical protein
VKLSSSPSLSTESSVGFETFPLMGGRGVPSSMGNPEAPERMDGCDCDTRSAENLVWDLVGNIVDCSIEEGGSSSAARVSGMENTPPRGR